MRALLALLPLALACASPPCPAQLELHGSSTRGHVSGADAARPKDRTSGQDYRERTVGASVVLDLQTHRRDCPLWAGERTFQEEAPSRN